MSYCSITDVRLRTGSILEDEVIQALIDDAGDRIDAYLAPHGIAGSGSAIRSAALSLVRAGLYDRARADGTRPDSSSEGDYSETLNIEAAIARYEREALKTLDRYVATVAPSRRYVVRKVTGR